MGSADRHGALQAPAHVRRHRPAAAPRPAWRQDPCYLFRAGSAFDELVVAGPTVTTCLTLEKAAEATEILVDPVAAAGFGSEHCATVPEHGRRLMSRPAAGAAAVP